MIPQWTKVGEYATRLDAEIARARLESAKIPATIKADTAGIFGPGFQGAVPSGVEVLVPRDRLSKARELLDAQASSSD